MATMTYDAVNFELADIGTRFTALLVDALILSAVGTIGFATARETGAGAGLLIGLAYQWYFLTRNNGQTPGKALMKIRVIKVDGSPISGSDAIMRWVGYIVNNFFGIGWLWSMFDTNHQGWHDKLANTYVVKAG